MKTSRLSEWTVQIAFGAALLIMIGLGALSYRTIAVASESDKWLRHTHEVLKHLQNLRYAVEATAASIRGFVLNGQESYLDSYRANRTLAVQSLATLRQLTVDNAGQQRRISILDERVAIRLSRIEQIIVLYRTVGPEAAAEDIRVGPGQRNTGVFQEVFAQMDAEEQRLLLLRANGAKQDVGNIVTLLIAGTAFAFVIIAAAGWNLHRYSAKRRAAEEALFEEKERAEVTLASIGDAVARTNIAGKLTYLNAVAEKMTGWPWQEAAGRPMAEVLHIVDGATRKVIPNPMELAVAQDRNMNLPANSVLIRRDGFQIPIEDSVAPIHDPQGRATGAVIVFRDVTVARAMALQMTYAVEHDFLTGLPNRTLLNDRINQAIAVAPRHSRQVAVLFLDLDGFKQINDSLGHSIGDSVLQSVAKRLVASVRGSDTVSRHGGDEFVVLLSEVLQLEDAALTATRMLEALAQPLCIDQHELRVTASIGVSVHPEDGVDAATLIQNADAAMYQAKEGGRQGYRFFGSAMNERSVERQLIEESLRRALERRELALHYQPKVDLDTGRITGAEALIRWTDDTRGSVSPAHFISIAEACGLMLPIGAWVLREACTQARGWMNAGLGPVTMAVNLSALEFGDDNFLDGLFKILGETGLEPKYLELDITEPTLIKSPAVTAHALKTLRTKGVQVAIDDFRTGHSSLGNLRKFPVDALKIDPSFVRHISTAGDDTAIVTAVIGMARSLNLRVIAEGVETSEELEFLRAHHCDEAQGYYFSYPVPAAQFAKLLETGIAKPAVAA